MSPQNNFCPSFPSIYHISLFTLCAHLWLVSNLSYRRHHGWRPSWAAKVRLICRIYHHAKREWMVHWIQLIVGQAVLRDMHIAHEDIAMTDIKRWSFDVGFICIIYALCSMYRVHWSTLVQKVFCCFFFLSTVCLKRVLNVSASERTDSLFWPRCCWLWWSSLCALVWACLLLKRVTANGALFSVLMDT